MPDALNAALTIAVAALCTWFTRALPHLLFGGRALPGWLRELGDRLPAAIMVILVVYCLRGTGFAAWPHGLPEALSLLAAVGLQLWKKNAVISVFAATALYMLLTQTVFAA